MKLKAKIIIGALIDVILLLVVLQQLFAMYDIAPEFSGNNSFLRDRPKPEPKLEPIVLDDVFDRAPYLGNNTDIVVLEFADFTDAYSGAVAGTRLGLISSIKGNLTSWDPPVPELRRLAAQAKIRFIFVPVPLSNNKNSEIAAVAAECAHEQGKFWQYHDILFDNQNRLDAEHLKLYASQLGMDTEIFDKCLGSRKASAKVQQNMEYASQNDVTSAPTFLVNGKRITSIRLIEVIEFILEEKPVAQ